MISETLEFVPERRAAKKATTQIKKTEKVLTPKPKNSKSVVITNNELRAKCAKFGLKTGGIKDTLLARLQEYENKNKTESQSTVS